MTEKQLSLIQYVLNSDGGSILPEEDLVELSEAVDNELHELRVTAFVQNMDAQALQANYGSKDNKFLNMSWQITFGDETIVLDNDLKVFDAMHEVLDIYLEGI